MRFLLLILLVMWLPAPAQALEAKAYCTKEDAAKYIPARKRLKTLKPLVRLFHCKHPTNYLFGTVHLDNKDVINASQNVGEIMPYLRGASFEVIASERTQTQVISHILLPAKSKETLQTLLGEALYTRVKNIVMQQHKDFPEAVLQRYQPWASTILMEYPAPSGDGIVLDEVLQRRFKKADIPLFSLESVNEQFATFSSLSLTESLMLADNTAQNIESIRRINSELEKHYIKGDMRAIERLSTQTFKEIKDKKLRAKLQNGIIHERNNLLTQRMLSTLEHGEHFVAVGVLHLVGKGGVIERLEKEGYFVF